MQVNDEGLIWYYSFCE